MLLARAASLPLGGCRLLLKGDVAQRLERWPVTPEVASSNLVIPAKFLGFFRMRQIDKVSRLFCIVANIVIES